MDGFNGLLSIQWQQIKRLSLPFFIHGQMSKTKDSLIR